MSTNSTGGTNTVIRYRAGDYEVRMPGLGATPGGNVQVSAYGNHTNRCKTTYWLPLDGAMAVGVMCHNPSGALADTPFTAQFHRGSNDPQQQSALYRSETRRCWDRCGAPRRPAGILVR
ncbi:hypothetical protein [Jidongwangia harbinensis]|uniref:hypothetical protein n=1 Tax=Jidongwangia harbinensis TaxID=2878561 RepID=UPI001CD99D56|nr:hypothetical protein [Jidongwangia harbinensis]MCA2218000.1 hypothetical protein [Jidongwangia harbinensis]